MTDKSKGRKDPAAESAEGQGVNHFDAWLADAKKKGDPGDKTPAKPEAAELGGDDRSPWLGDEKPKDAAGGEEQKPWFLREEPRKPSYARPPDPDRGLTPHYGDKEVVFFDNRRAPRVLITPNAYKRMCLYVELAEKEVGWLGTVVMTRNGDFLIDHTYLLEQEVTATETELSAEGQAKLVEDLLKKGEPGFEEVNRLRFWGHSHVRMGTSPSGTDESTMKRFYEEGLPWYVRGIFNKKGRAEFCIFLYEQGLRINDVDWFVVDPATGNTLLEYERPSLFGGKRKRWKKVPKPEPKEGEDKETHERIWGWRDNYALVEVEQEKKPAPAELAIDDALRAEVKAEFELKVKERKFFSLWDTLFGSGDDDKAKKKGEAPASTDSSSDTGGDAAKNAAAPTGPEDPADKPGSK